MFISIKEYFEKMINLGYVPSSMTIENAEQLLKQVNDFLTYLFKEKLLPTDYKIEMSSGWRPEAFNKKIGGAPMSKHITGNAIDFSGVDLVKLAEKDVKLLEMFNLYAESSFDSKNHTHFQNLPPKSNNRIFRA